MLVKTEEIEDCKLHIIYEADPDVVREKEEKAIDELRKLPIPGFRPGKATDQAIRLRCKKQLKRYLSREMATYAYDDIIYETDIKPIGNPILENETLNGHTYKCEMTILKKPNFELCDYKNIELPRPKTNQDMDSYLEDTIKDICMRYGEVEPYGDEDFVEKNDQVTMDLVTTTDGKESKEEGILYTVGENRLSGMDENLLGMMPGEEREFDLESGENQIFCKVKIHMGMKRTPAELDDELAKKIGLKNVDEIKEKIAVLLKNQLEGVEKALVHRELKQLLVDKTEIKLPKWLVDMEAQHIAMNQNIDWTQLKDEDRELFFDQAKSNVKLSLILDSVRSKEPESVLSESEAVEILKNQVGKSNQDQEKFIVEQQQSGALLGLVSGLREDFTLQWIADQVTIID